MADAVPQLLRWEFEDAMVSPLYPAAGHRRGRERDEVCWHVAAAHCDHRVDRCVVCCVHDA
jgi:hypothetical protein